MRSKNWNKSSAGKAAKKRYRQSPKGKEAAKRARKKYNKNKKLSLSTLYK